MAKVDGFGIATTAIGSVLILAGIKGYSTLKVVENLVSGRPPLTNVNVNAPLTTGVDSSTPVAVIQGDSAKVTASILAKQYGWDSGAEWDALVKLWERESSWNPRAQNPSSGAYGIPQALPYSKMPKAAWPESAGGSSDPQTQIQWGLDYIRGRYGSPSMAWQHEIANGWY